MWENSDVNITDLCFTSQCYRDHHPYRMAFLINSVEELVEKLTIIVKYDELNNIPEKNIYYGYSVVIPDKRQKREGEIYENELQKYSSYANEIIKEGLKPSVMEKLCSLYVKSADINWKQLYDQEYKKVHYPGYSFLQERCWISQVAQREEKHEYGDIKCIARTKLQWVYAITFSPQKSWQLYEHKIWGQPLLPGTVYIEIIKNIASDISGMKSINLSELVFLSPVLCKTDAPVEIFVILNLEDDFIKFRFESEEKLSDESSNWLVHAEGILKNLHKNDEIIDIDSLKKSYFNGNQIMMRILSVLDIDGIM